MNINDLIHIFTSVEKTEGIKRATLAIICYAASEFEQKDEVDLHFRRMVEMNFDNYASLFADLKMFNPMLMLPEFLDQLCTRTGIFQVRYSDAVDQGYHRSFQDLSEPDTNTRWAVILMKRRGLEWGAPWYKAVQIYDEILGARKEFMDRANDFYLECARHSKK